MLPLALPGTKRFAVRVASRSKKRVASSAFLVALLCLASLSRYFFYGDVAFISARLSESQSRANRARLTKTLATREDLRMVLGVPKVAYRIPGAANAEWVDIYNRLYRERIVFLGKEIDDRLANEIIGVLLYLDSEDSEKPIYLYINSPGGSVISGLAIYDTMQHIKSPVITINIGLAASMASFLLAAGEKGKRMALPHSRTMIHQAMGGAQGQAEDIKVEAEQILKIHQSLVSSYSHMTGQTEDTIRKDLLRDNFMSAVEAKEYGLIDQVIELQDASSFVLQARAVASHTPVEPYTPAIASDDDDELDAKAV